MFPKGNYLPRRTYCVSPPKLFVSRKTMYFPKEIICAYKEILCFRKETVCVSKDILCLLKEFTCLNSDILRFPKYIFAYRRTLCVSIIVVLGQMLCFPNVVRKLNVPRREFVFTLSEVHEEPNDSHKVVFLLGNFHEGQDT